MQGTTPIRSGQPALEPTQLQQDGLQSVDERWRHAMYLHQPCEGLYVSCINGRPASQWAFRAEGPPAFSINILLEGRIQTALDDGSVLDVRSGSAILMASGQHVSGWDVLDGKSEGAFRLASIHIPQAVMSSLTGLEMDELRSRAHAIGGSQSHIDAFLAAIPASSGLRRVASDLIGLSSGHPGACLARDLYLRAKAFEAIACFVQENLTRRQAALPVPGDRARLVEARALLEQGYEQNWTLQTLSRAVGLHEKRLQSGFQALFGGSVHACLTRIRINAAITQLQRGVSVTETAFNCGFANLSHFSRVFRSHTGLSPKQCAMGGNPRMPPLAGDAFQALN
ncbi:helix-turn-helix transcriptional regulator [Stutzerimonas kirkiae]|uniref:helix-turn-helix transcriptional regulator n=1 Tax=Stutzerimonas kirkiae TaxID=2211392 RepID=UPI001038560C|nr:AraC family transcriptional regulator [Stutzerimonas kirkiae]TBV08102.1 hypothetical protein DNK08_11205 [Stutzerimonas kirkiae]TBV17558.1 hypothetical protein DNK01_01530 [Stutzerimonas kirkiae]